MATNKNLPSVAGGDSTIEAILAHYINPAKYPLTPIQEDIRERLSVVFSLRLSHYSKTQIVNKLMKDHGVKLAQAYNDIRDSELLYGNVLKSNKEGARALHYEYALDLLKRSVQKGDRKSEIKALELMDKFSGGSDADNPGFDPEKLQKKEVTVALPKQLQEKLKGMVLKGVIDFNDLNVTDIEFEEVK